MLKLVVKRSLRQSLLTGRKFDVEAKLVSDQDLRALFKHFPDELVLAYKSAFDDKAISLKRSDLVRGYRFTAASLNEIIEFEDRAAAAFDRVRRMIELVSIPESETEIGDEDGPPAAPVVSATPAAAVNQTAAPIAPSPPPTMAAPAVPPASPPTPAETTPLPGGREEPPLVARPTDSILAEFRAAVRGPADGGDKPA